MWKTDQKSAFRHHFVSLSLSGPHQRNAAQQHHQMLITYGRLPGGDLFVEYLIATTHQTAETVVALAHIGADLVDEILPLGTKP